MNVSRRVFVVLAGSVAMVAVSTQLALAQTPIDPSVTPVENTGGWVFSMAQLLAVLGGITTIFLVVMYMRFAPRFAKGEEGSKVVRADRVRPGEALPRRAVDISQAAPIVVPPPAVPAAVAAAPTRAPAPASAPAPTPAPAPEPPPSTAPAASAAPAPVSAEAPAAQAPPASAPPAPAERVEVSLDQEVFDAKLAELLEQGTDRRVAEGQARRAAMIAARKKAAGG